MAADPSLVCTASAREASGCLVGTARIKGQNAKLACFIIPCTSHHATFRICGPSSSQGRTAGSDADKCPAAAFPVLALQGWKMLIDMATRIHDCGRPSKHPADRTWGESAWRNVEKDNVRLRARTTRLYMRYQCVILDVFRSLSISG
jgi:hypothetical protein